MIQRTNTHQIGFTLVELMLAMSFISFILLFMVFAIVQVMGNYSKGLAIKEINQTSRGVVDELSRLVRATNAQAIDTTVVTSERRLCFGTVSYVWNIRDENVNEFNDGSRVTLVRAKDNSGALCRPVAGVYPDVNKVANEPVSLLTDQIWVQQISVIKNGGIANITVRLSTSGSNQPTGVGPSAVCAGGPAGQYCAVGVYATTVTTRNGGE